MRSGARLFLLLGAIAIGFWLFRSAPRDVTLVYAGAAPATALEVTIARRGDVVRHAELRFASGAPAQVEHRVRLPEGEYTLHLRLSGGGAPREVERPLTVAEDGPVVLNVGP
ncbi:MAG TPA: hypothetical protein VFP65_10755 [Anaeromyxobacteraceae bacterium]|nr:hypothetical protein [Anaeromyxobacteraceae bacterium]